MLTVILGRARDGKTTQVIDTIGELMEQGKRSIVIVPDQVTYAMEKSICARLDRDGFSLCSVLSFNRFCHRVATSAGVKCPQRLSDAGRLMLIENAISICRDGLSVYKRSCKKSGFALRMERMLALLKSCRVTPEALEKMVEASGQSLLKQKLADTALIYRQYEGLAGEDYCDNNDLFAIAAENLDAPFVKQCHIFIDGFDTLTAQMLWLIEKLVKVSDVTVTLSMDEDSPWLYSGQMQTYSALCAAASRYQGSMRTVSISKRVRGNAFDSLHNLYALSSAAEPSKKENGNGAIELYVAKNTEDEVRRAAYSIRQKIKNGARYRDFAVACADESLISTVERVFAAYGMPVFCDTARPMLSQPAVQLILSALEVCRNDNGTQIVDYLSNYLCPLSLENAQQLRVLIGSLGLSNKEIIVSCNRLKEQTEQQINKLKNGLEPLGRLRERLLQCSGADDFADALWEFISATELSKRLEELIKRCQESNMLAEADEYKQVWDNIIAQLEQINMLMAKNSSDVDVELYIDMLKRGFESQNCFVLPSTVDLITVGDPERSRFDGTKELYVLGAADGYFPVTATGEGLLSPVELQNINRKEKILTPDMRDSSVRSLFRLFSMLLTPEVLHISYSLKKGRSAQSQGRLLELIRQHCAVEEAQASQEVMLASRASATELLASLKGKYDPQQAAAYEALRLQGAADKKHFEFSLDTPCDGRVLYGDVPISMSKLETQAECPLKNLLSGGLRLKENIEYDSDSSDIGNIMHETLEKSVAELLEVERNDDFDATVDMVVEKNLYASARSVHDGVMLHTARARLLCNRLNKSVSASCKQIMSQLDDFHPYAFEVAFGREGAEPIIIDTKYGKVKLQGKIDRVDLNKDKTALRIVDYKSSDHKISQKTIQEGTTLQLPLYMLAMEQATGARGVAMYYQNCFASGAPYGIYCEHPLTAHIKAALPQENFRELLNISTQTAIRLAEDMLSGSAECCDAKARTDTSHSPCSFCGHRSSCFARAKDR